MLREQRPLTSDEVRRCEQSFPDAFREVALAHANDLAVGGDGKSTTYAQLDRDSDRIAAGLVRDRGERTEVVAVLIDDPDRFVGALLGVLKAGKVAMPLDPYAPAAYRQRLLEDADATMTLSTAHQGAADTPGSLRAIDEYVAVESEPVSLAIPPHHPAILHYTSGTTGRPKAVVFPHAVCIYYCAALQDIVGAERGTRVAMLTPPAFAVSTGLISLTLLSGGALFYYPAARQGMAGLPAWLNDHGIDLSLFVPAALRAVAVSGIDIPSLKTVLVGGDAVRRSDVVRAFELFGPGVDIMHSYGSSEAGWIAIHKLTPSELNLGASHLGEALHESDPLAPAGLPVPGKSISLDTDMETAAPTPRRGEVVVTSRYLPPEQQMSGADLVVETIKAGSPTAEVVFRTGDLGEMNAEGLLVVLGRIARTVKIRGTLIDLTLVERELLAQETVSETAVVTTTGPRGQTLLRAIVVPSAPVDITELKEALRSSLPVPMVPTEILVAEEMPTLANGKVDLRAISELGRPPSRMQGAEADAEGLERALADIWSDVLGIVVSSDDDFFELGGDSLAAVEALLAIEEDLGLEVRGTDLIIAPSVRELAELLRAREGGDMRRPARVSRGRDQDPRLFFVPPIGGSVLQLRPLANALANEIVIYGVAAWDRESAGRTVAEEARMLLAGVRMVQPCGPYWFGGHSSGGFVALEMARAVEAEGESVAGVLALDPKLSSRYSPPPAPRPATEEHGRLSAKERLSTYARSPLAAIERDLVQLGLGPVVDRTVWRIDLRRRGKVRPYRRQRFLWEMQRKALQAYAPGPCRAPLTLLRSPDKLDPVVDRSWRDIALGGLVVLDVDVPHDELLAAEHIATIARAVRDACPWRDRTPA